MVDVLSTACADKTLLLAESVACYIPWKTPQCMNPMYQNPVKTRSFDVIFDWFFGGLRNAVCSFRLVCASANHWLLWHGFAGGLGLRRQIASESIANRPPDFLGFSYPQIGLLLMLITTVAMVLPNIKNIGKCECNGNFYCDKWRKETQDITVMIITSASISRTLLFESSEKNEKGSLVQQWVEWLLVMSLVSKWHAQ